MLSNEILIQIIEDASDAVIVADSEQRIQFFNHEAQRLFGYTSDEILTQPLEVLIPKRYRRNHQQHVETFAASHSSAQFMSHRPELFAIAKDGSEIPVEITISTATVDGETFVTSIVRDIREKKKLEQELKKTIKEAEERNAELQTLSSLKDNFLGMAAHDLRNPVSRIKLSAELLSGQNISPQQSEKVLAMITKTANSMLNLINDLLDINKIESGKIQLKPALVSIPEYFKEICESEIPLAERKGIDISYQIEEDLPRVSFDPNRICQVLENLLSNAIKFSSTGTTTTVNVYRRDNFLMTEVTDQGPGIKAEDIEKIFSPFQQLSNQATAGEAGTGLGLAIVKKIIELHGGNVSLESSVGKGSTFSFALPISAN